MEQSFHLSRAVTLRLLIAAFTAAILAAFGVGLSHASPTKVVTKPAAAQTQVKAAPAADKGQGGAHKSDNGTPNPPPSQPPCDADGGHPDLKPCHETGAECSDNRDNDGDGATDAEDSDCTETGDECSDGVDNDGDGATDAEDSDCQSDGGGGGDTCSDGQDNDGDGATDGDDTECQDPNDGVEDGSDQGGGATNTCATGGLLMDETLAETIAGPGIDENGPISSQLHSQLEPNLGPLEPVGHEASCVVAILDGT
jgi:hypothetical protein